MLSITAYSVAVVVALLSVVIGGAVSVWLLARYDRATSAFAFGVFMLIVTIWSATHLGTLRAETVRWQLLYTQLSYVGVVFVPVAWLVFVLRYIDRDEWLSNWRIVLLSALPLVTLAVVFTVRSHSLFYTSYSMASAAGHPILRVNPGPWYFVNIVYSYTLLAIGTGLLAASALSNNRLYRRQAAALIAVLTVPWVVSGSYLAGIRPIPWVDPTPMAFVAISGPLALLVVRTDLTVFLPVAHERLFRTLEDPILVVGPTHTVVDANPAARTVLADRERIEGEPVAEVVPDALLAGTVLETDADQPVECTITHDGRQHQYLARCRVIDPERNPTTQGYLVSLTDITVQKDQQRALERTNQQLERLANVVSHDMAAPLSTAEKTLSLLRSDLNDPDPDVERSLTALETVHDRLRGFAAHLPRLARESIDVESTEPCDLATLAESAWSTVDTGDLSLSVTDTRTVHGDRRRLKQVFENLFRNSVEHATTSSQSQLSEADTEHSPAIQQSEGATTVRVGTIETGVYLEDDGPGIGPEQRESVFEYGMSTGDSSGFGLAIVRTIVEAHGWEIAVTESDAGGARFEIRTDD